MGCVYESIDERLNSLVAIKEALIEDDEARRAFEREANLLANLRHSSLPKVIDHFIEDNRQFLVMEFIQGTDLAKLLALRGRAFPVEEVLRWADITLGVLDYLHRRNPPILHRDIKPANLKLDEDGALFLLDFGLAKGAAGQMPTFVTSRSVRGYTPVYAPIEQIFGKGTDQRSDLYAVGATLYHLITNMVPVDAPTRYIAIEDDQPDPLRPADEVNPKVPHSVAVVLSQAMAINRKHRPSSAAEMRLALHEAGLVLSVAQKAESKSPDTAPVKESQTAASESERSDPPAALSAIETTDPNAPSTSQMEKASTDAIDTQEKIDEETTDASANVWKRRRVGIAIAGLFVVLAAVVYGIMNKSRSPSQSTRQTPPVTAPSTQPSPGLSTQPEEPAVGSSESVDSNSPGDISNNSNTIVENDNQANISTNKARRVAARPTKTPSKTGKMFERAKKIIKNPF